MGLLQGVSSADVSRVMGYVIGKGNFNDTTPNLPMSLAIFGEANDDNQSGLSTTKQVITSAQQAGKLYGYGSPIYLQARILFPLNGGGGVGGVPVTVFPQAKPDGATSAVYEVGASGVANNNGTHYLRIAGRKGMDGSFYAININSGDTSAEITTKIQNAVNAILGSPVKATSTEYEAILTTKWSGLTADDLTVSVDTGNDDLGITYDIIKAQDGSGTPDISAALNQFGNTWYTIVSNGYGLQSDIVSALESFNGIPDQENPTGRYTGIVMKPFIALSGSTLEDPSSLTTNDKLNVTIAVCPAPKSPGFAFEAAANAAVLLAVQAQNAPHLDISGQNYPDMPVPANNASIGAMAVYNNRNTIMQAGCSTVDLVNGVYQIQDFVTTYHPDGEVPPQFRYVRALIQDFNVFFGYYLMLLAHVVDHVIANDTDTVTASNVIRPKQLLGLLDDYAIDLGSRALIVDVPFMQKNTTVTLDSSNPDRFNISFSYKRSGYTRVLSAVATAGFNFGTLNG